MVQRFSHGRVLCSFVGDRVWLHTNKCLIYSCIQTAIRCARTCDWMPNCTCLPRRRVDRPKEADFVLAIRLPMILGFAGSLAIFAKKGIELMPEPLTLGIFGLCLFIVASAVRGRSVISNQATSNAKESRRERQQERHPMVDLDAVRSDPREIQEQVASQ